MKNNEDKIISRLLLLKHQGKTKSEDLEEQLGATGSEIRGVVQELRRQGVPITSDSEGYGFAKTKEEIMPTLKHLKTRAMSLLVTISKLERNFVKPASQDDLFRESVIDEIIEEIRRIMENEH